MKKKKENKRYPQYGENKSYLMTDVHFDSISPIENRKITYDKNKLKIHQSDVDKLLDKTEHSLNDFFLTLTNERNTNQPKSIKKIPNRIIGRIKKVNEINRKINETNFRTDSNKQNNQSYIRNNMDYIDTQSQLIGNSNYNNIEGIKEYKNYFYNDFNKIVLRKKSNYNLNKKKIIDSSFDINKRTLNNSFSKKTFMKRDLSPLETNNKTNKSNRPLLKTDKSFDNIINESNQYKKLLSLYKNKNTFLIIENEKYKKEIIFLRKFKKIAENMENENKKLKQQLLNKKLNRNNNRYKYNLSISNEYFMINKKPNNNTKNNKDIILSLKKEIKNLKQRLNFFKNNENKNNNIICPSEHDINMDQIEKIKKQKNDLEEQNIFLIQELNDIKKNRDFIINNNYLDKKNKSLNNQILNLKEKIKRYNNLQIYIKLFFQNKCISTSTNDKEQFLLRKIQEELDLIQQTQNIGRGSLQPTNNYIQNEINIDNNII